MIMLGSIGSLRTMFTLFMMWVLLVHLGLSDDGCQLTARDEVNALRDIAKELGKKDWNFDVDPCNRSTSDSSWFSGDNNARPTYLNQVGCRCIKGKFHLTNISLMGQDLAGVLPKSLAKLPYLNLIVLPRNLLKGTIPREWETLKLRHMSVMGNRLSGHIPKYLGKITTLQHLNIGSNSFSGTVPAELGKLISLQNLLLSDNFLTGQLPVELKNLLNLSEMKIQGSGFAGPS